MIYLIITEDKQYLKIGYTDSNVEKRLHQLQAGCPMELLVLETFQGTIQDEKYLHYICREHHVRREWFKFSEQLLELIHSDKTSISFIDKKQSLERERKEKKDLIFKTELPKNNELLETLLKEAEEKKHDGEWVFIQLYRKSNYMFKSNIQKIADKYNFDYWWVRFKIIDCVGKVYNDLK